MLCAVRGLVVVLESRQHCSGAVGCGVNQASHPLRWDPQPDRPLVVSIIIFGIILLIALTSLLWDEYHEAQVDHPALRRDL